MFEDLIGRKCRILKKDGYTKVGKILEVKNGFIKIELDKSFLIQYIAESLVESIDEMASYEN